MIFFTLLVTLSINLVNYEALINDIHSIESRITETTNNGKKRNGKLSLRKGASFNLTYEDGDKILGNSRRTSIQIGKKRYSILTSRLPMLKFLIGAKCNLANIAKSFNVLHKNGEEQLVMTNSRYFKELTLKFRNNCLIGWKILDLYGVTTDVNLHDSIQSNIVSA